MSIVGAGIGPSRASQVFMSDPLPAACSSNLLSRSVSPKLPQILDEELKIESFIFHHSENENSKAEFYTHCSDDCVNYSQTKGPGNIQVNVLQIQKNVCNAMLE